MSQQNVEELGQEEILSLLKEAQKHEPEAKYILEIRRSTRPNILDKIGVIFGDAEIIPIDQDRVSEEEVDIVLPKSSPTIVIIKTVSIYPQYNGETGVYVFTGTKGWVRVS